ncbi:MAG: CAP domain-containing protein [Defluviitaleaceae bacterium]|nr:CAP domain-containing protein [Defluviitaleaceae bacterium]
MKRIIKFFIAAVFAVMLAVMPAVVYGAVLGDVLHTNVRVTINSVPIMGYNIDGETFVVAEDLAAYSFEVHWDAEHNRLSLQRAPSSAFPQDVPLNTEPSGTVAFNFFYTDIATYVEGDRVLGFNIDGRTVVQIDEIARLTGSRIVWRPEQSLLAVALSPLQNIDDHRPPVTPIEYGLFNAINAQRVAAGLNSLYWDGALANIVQRRFANERPVYTDNLAVGIYFSRISHNFMTTDFFMSTFMDIEADRVQILNPDVTRMGIGYLQHPHPTQDGYVVHIGIFFATPYEIPTNANPFDINNMVDAGGMPMSQIILPNRRATDNEREAWIAEYRAMGGASAFEMEVIRLINIERVALGLAYLQVDDTLMMSGRYYTQIQSNLDTMNGHNQGPYADDPTAGHGASFNVATAFGANMLWEGGNAFAGPQTPEDVVRGWMDSPGHRAYITSPEHRFIGFGTTLGGRWGVFHYMFASNNPSNPQ